MAEPAVRGLAVHAGMESYVFAPTLAALIDARAEATPDAPMLFDEHDRLLTFSQYAAGVREMAATFVALGVEPGDVVAWQLPTRIETVVLMGALARRGATQVPVLPICRERELRFMTGGGAPMPPSMHLEVRSEIGGRGCAHGYGMSETGSILAMNHPDDDAEHLCHTSGRVVPGMEARVVTSSGKLAPPGVEGEVRVRGEHLLAGYVDASLDADAFDEDGWFRSGDLGSLDADGYVRVTGRIKDIIIRKGENISAKELEDLLYAHPSIADVAVIGLPDDERGELVCAVVVPAPGLGPPDLSSVSTYLDTRQLMRQKYPERLELVDALPRNAAGKVMKQTLVRAYRRASGTMPA